MVATWADSPPASRSSAPKAERAWTLACWVAPHPPYVRAVPLAVVDEFCHHCPGAREVCRFDESPDLDEARVATHVGTFGEAEFFDPACRTRQLDPGAGPITADHM